MFEAENVSIRRINQYMIGLIKCWKQDDMRVILDNQLSHLLHQKRTKPPV